MADETVDIDVNINANTGQAEGSFKRLQTQIRETTTLLQEAEAAGDTVSFNKYRKELDDLQDQLEITNLKQQQFDDTLAAAPGVLGKAGQAVKAFDGALKFLAANPVIGILAGLAAALAGVVAALNKTQAGTAALTRVTDAFGTILNTATSFISATAVPVFEGFANVVNFLATKLGLVDEKVVKAKEDFRSLELQQKKNNATLEGEIALMEAQGKGIDVIAVKKKEQIDGEIKLLEAKRKAFGEITAEEEAEIIKLNNKKKVIDAEVKVYLDKKAADAKKAKEEELKAQADFTKKLEDITTQSIENTVEQAKQERANKYREDLVALEADVRFIKMSDDAKNLYRSQLKQAYDQDVKKINDDARIKEYDDELKFLALKQEGFAKNSQSFFDGQAEILRVAHDKEVFEAKGNAEKLLDIERKYQQSKKELKQQEVAAIGQVISATISSFAAVTGAVASGYDEEAKTSKAAFEKRKKLQKATAILSAASGIIQILTQPSTLPSPIDFIVKGANAIALGIATGIQIKQIDKTQFEGASSSGGGDSISNTPATPSFSVPTIGAPQIGATSAQEGTIAGIAAGTIAGNNSKNRPLRAYVVGNDITTEQQFQRRISAAARLGG